MAPALNVTDVVNFKMSKDCRLELAIFWRGPPLVALSAINLLFCKGTLIDLPCLAILVWHRFRVILSHVISCIELLFISRTDCSSARNIELLNEKSIISKQHIVGINDHSIL